MNFTISTRLIFSVFWMDKQTKLSHLYSIPIRIKCTYIEQATVQEVHEVLQYIVSDLSPMMWFDLTVVQIRYIAAVTPKLNILFNDGSISVQFFRKKHLLDVFSVFCLSWTGQTVSHYCIRTVTTFKTDTLYSNYMKRKCFGLTWFSRVHFAIWMVHEAQWQLD